MKTPRNLDEIIRTATKINKKKRPKVYCQAMQSLRGKRKFLLCTSYITGMGTKIALWEEFQDNTERLIGNRWTSPEPEVIQKSIKSLEKKAKCKLYYVLLISTDGEYL